MQDSAAGRAIPIRAAVNRLLHVLCVSLALVAAAGVRAEEAGPRVVVAAFQDSLLATMKEAEAFGFEGRYEKLLPAVERAFDIEQMTRVVVGKRWSKLSAAERTEIVEMFRRFSVSTYASEFSGYGGEKFEITGERPQPGVGTIVDTRLVLEDEAPIALNYLLHETPAGWQILDVHLAGSISELARRRDEFASIIRRDGVAGLIALLKKKSAELARS